MVYTEFLSKKELLFKPVGFTPRDEINPILYPFQRDIVLWALKKGRACLFENCGLGKTPQQLEWAKHVSCKEKESYYNSAIKNLKLAESSQKSML